MQAEQPRDRLQAEPYYREPIKSLLLSGAGVDTQRIGQRVWCYGALSYRPFGTAAEYCVVPEALAVPLPEHIAFEQGACLGIPAITAHRAVHTGGPIVGRWVLVQGGAGAVGRRAVQLAHRAGAQVMATVRKPGDEPLARRAGVQHVFVSGESLVERVTSLAPGGVAHIAEVAFAANILVDCEVLAVGGSISAFCSDRSEPEIPFWPMVFKNVRVHFLGSDDFPVR